MDTSTWYLCPGIIPNHGNDPRTRLTRVVLGLPSRDSSRTCWLLLRNRRRKILPAIHSQRPHFMFIDQNFPISSKHKARFFLRWSNLVSTSGRRDALGLPTTNARTNRSRPCVCAFASIHTCVCPFRTHPNLIMIFGAGDVDSLRFLSMLMLDAEWFEPNCRVRTPFWTYVMLLRQSRLQRAQERAFILCMLQLYYIYCTSTVLYYVHIPWCFIQVLLDNIKVSQLIILRAFWIPKFRSRLSAWCIETKQMVLDPLRCPNFHAWSMKRSLPNTCTLGMRIACMYCISTRLVPRRTWHNLLVKNNLAWLCRLLYRWGITCTQVAVRAMKIAAERGPWGQLVKEAYDAYAQHDEIGAFIRYRLAAESGYRTAQVPPHILTGLVYPVCAVYVKLFSLSLSLIVLCLVRTSLLALCRLVCCVSV